MMELMKICRRCLVYDIESYYLIYMETYHWILQWRGLNLLHIDLLEANENISQAELGVDELKKKYPGGSEGCSPYGANARDNTRDGAERSFVG